MLNSSNLTRHNSLGPGSIFASLPFQNRAELFCTLKEMGAGVWFIKSHLPRQGGLRRFF